MSHIRLLSLCQVLLISFILVFTLFADCHADDPPKKKRQLLSEKMQPWRARVRELIAKRKGFIYKLTHPDPKTITETPDSELIKSAVEGFRKQQFVEVLEILNTFVRDHRDSQHFERANFLKGVTIDRLTRLQLPVDYIKIIKSYRESIETLPDSEYVPHINLSLGDIYFELGKYYDALLYYNLADNHDFKLNPEALLKKGVAYQLIEKVDQGIEVFDRVIQDSPNKWVLSQAQIEKAKALFVKKSYKQSQQLIDTLLEMNPEAVYRYSDILYYSGYNYYEMEDGKRAIQAFNRVINLFPEHEATHLIYTRIADIYSEMGDIDKAIVIYNRVLNDYPDTNGGLISALRLVDIAKVDPKKRFEKRTINEVTYNRVPIEMYEEIIRKHADSPLAHLAMLKMAMIKHDEGDLAGSIHMLKNILQDHPDTPLREDVRSALRTSITDLAKLNYEKGLYSEILTYYNQYQDFLTMDELSGEFLIIIGNAYMRMELYRYAENIFEHAMKQFLEKDYPTELVYGVAETSFFLDHYDIALKYYFRFIDENENEKREAHAYLRIGTIQFNQKEYDKCVFYLEKAIYGLPKDNLLILTMIGRSLRISSRYQRAVDIFNEIIDIFPKMKTIPKETIFDTYNEQGECYFKLGNRKDAAVAYEKALKIQTEDENYIRTQFRLAECYQHLQLSDKAESVLKAVQASKYPFWQKLAESKLEEIRMNKKLYNLASDERAS